MNTRVHAQPEITIVLDRLRSAFNAGNIFRLADAVGAKEVICCGYTPAPPHAKLSRSALGAEISVPFRTFPTSLDAVRVLRSEGCAMAVAVEVSERSVTAWELEYRFPLAIVFGNEALGVEENTLSECDAVVSLPMFGKKTSINVGNCASAVLYSIMSKYSKGVTLR